MRVTIVLPHAGLAGGIRVAAIYAQVLSDRGHTVQVVSTPRKQPAFSSKVRSLLKGRGWPKDTSKESGHFDRTTVSHKVIESVRPIRADDVPDADVIVATWWETAEWIAGFPAEKGAKAYFIQHDERFINQPTGRVEATWKLPYYRITIAQWLVDLGLQEFGVDQIDLVPNGVDTRQFSSPPRSKQRTPTVGMMYSPAHFKGCDIAIEAFQHASRNVPGLRMVAFGQHHPTEQLQLPVGTKFTLRPAQDSIKDIYAACDVWLFASRSEGFGLPILEAMSCRTPVIGTPTGAAPELLHDGGGVLVKPQDPIDMAIAIERICRLTNDDWKILSDEAHTIAQKNTWDQNSLLFEQALMRAIEQNQPKMQ